MFAEAVSFGRAWVVPVEVFDDPLGLFDGSIQVEAGIVTPLPLSHLVHDEVGHDGVPGCVATFEGVHVARVVNALIEGLGGHVGFGIPVWTDLERAVPMLEAEVPALLIEGLR